MATTGKQKLAGAAGALVIAAAMIMPFEGRFLNAYLDPIGIPTICDGITKGVKLGDKATPAECDALLLVEMKKAESVFDQHAQVQVSDQTKAAFISFIYNVGSGKAGRKDGFVTLKSGRPSTMLKKLQAGDVAGACRELPKWANPPLRGLIRRRAAEMELCLNGIHHEIP